MNDTQMSDSYQIKLHTNAYVMFMFNLKPNDADNRPYDADPKLTTLIF